MNNDMSIPMGISRLGVLVSWAAVLTAQFENLGELVKNTIFVA